MSSNSTTNLTRRRTDDSHHVYSSPTADATDSSLTVADESPITVPQVDPSIDAEATFDHEREESVVTEQFIARLAEPVDAIKSAVNDECERSDSFRKRVERWCEVHGFDGPASDPSCELVARQSVCNVLCKTTLYEWYHRRGNLPELPDDIREGLRAAKNRTGNPVFDEYLLDDVAWLATTSDLERIATERTRLLRSNQPAEDIGTLYESLLPSDKRKTLGQYRTPPHIADTLREWAVDGGDTVLDPGMGPATLSSPRFPGWVLSDDPGHVYGIDRSPLSRLMGTVTLTLVGQDHDTRTSDFLALDPGQFAGDIDAIVCNPPYTGYGDLSEEYRSELNSRMEQLTERSIPGKTPLYGYFLYHAGACLTPGDRMAIVTPHHFLNRQYGTALKRYILDEFNIHALVLSEESLFDDADTTALLMFLEAKNGDDPDGITRLIKVDDPEAGEWHRSIPTVTSGTRDWGCVKHIDQSELRPEENWFRQLDPLTVDTTTLTPLPEIADVTRGISTGYNEFFCLTQSDVDRHGIDERYLRPLIRTVSAVDGYEFCDRDWKDRREADEEVWLLYLDDLDDVPDDLAEAKAAREEWAVTNEPEHSATGLYAYLEANIQEISSELCQNRSAWYRVERREPAQIVIRNYSRVGFDAVLNYTPALILSNGNCIYPDASMTKEEIKALAAYLNSTVGGEILRHHATTENEGADRLTMGELRDVEVIDPRTLDSAVVTELAGLAEELSEDDSDESDVVERIDAVLADYVF